MAEAATKVLWDINRCPVTIVDAPRIGACIKRALKNLGYTGQTTITAIGILTEVPSNILGILCSTGINLEHVPTGARGIMTHLCNWSMENRPPANLMVISGERNIGHFIAKLELEGYNIIRSIEASTSLELWESLVARLPEEEDENCSEASETAFVCSTCVAEKIDIQGFDSFIRHLNSKEHALEELEYYPAALEASNYVNYKEESARTVKAVLRLFRADSILRERQDEEDDKNKRERQDEEDEKNKRQRT